ncbi:MAG: hypothetical protein JXA14_22970 [Anaerolineae bacterium]|nr:hypothetical protein [Anaerolineae bacterium]
MQGPFLRKYGVATTINFTLFETDGVDLKVDAVHASGDTKIMKNEAAEANTTNGFTDEGQGYSLALSATEMEAARIVVYIVDQGTKVWLDTSVAIETYGHASAQHAFDLGTASTAQTGDSYVRLGAPAGASIAADIAVIEGQTDDIGAAGAGLTAVPWNAAWDAQVESEVTDALNTYDPPTKAELDAAVANVSVDEIQATALADLFNTNSGTTYASAVSGSPVKEIADNAAGASLTEGGIADAVWDETLSGHTGSGSAGEALDNAGSVGSATDVADAILDRDLDAVGLTDARRSLGQAMRRLVNKVVVSLGGTMSVYKENDTDVAWTATVTTNPSANNITEIDPT